MLMTAELNAASSPIRIEPADIRDAAELLDLQKRAFLSEAAIYDDHTIPQLTQTLESAESDFPHHIILKATVNGRIVGSVRAQAVGGACRIGRLSVDPGLQNRGVGTRLMCAIEQRFPDAVCYELFTGARSERNLHLYRKLGYRIVREEKGSGKVSFVHLEKRNRQT